jgi:hypothetical protein
MGGGNYSPDRDGPLGPYVIYIEQDESKAAVTSDMCIGFGLPGNRHVAYQVTYQEVAATETPETPAADNPGCGALIAALIKLIESWTKK